MIPTWDEVNQAQDNLNKLSHHSDQSDLSDKDGEYEEDKQDEEFFESKKESI